LTTGFPPARSIELDAMRSLKDSTTSFYKFLLKRQQRLYQQSGSQSLENSERTFDWLTVFRTTLSGSF